MTNRTDGGQEVPVDPLVSESWKEIRVEGPSCPRDHGKLRHVDGSRI